ncbi:sterol desaturase family protein [Persicimonas caeni]|uniref:Sterol desaturase family protein n=1 Tax=Persicimonas caeni TaxID=2292766 RepID=A0A4Y6PVC5_PERCE|nr:sterol desaturase family protein [Persicimonas caeni]QDG52301.1 sterol desaturase family protein [Persicimonas caeni]QED33523.1 sterol desaturase family protein [Persicimonas caeni]
MIPLIVIGIGIVMIAVELASPAREWPDVAGWWGRAILFNGIQVAAVYFAGVAWDGWMADHRLWSLDSLGPTLGGLVGYLVLTFVYYWWHRARHESQFLWNWLHQLHHSPRRLEIITSFYKHPIEIVTNALISSAVVYLLVGLSPTQAAYATLLSGLAEFFYHWNVKTPHWVGYIMQRPESHCVHHQRGLHRYNYGDLPLWDMLFGTFHNPKNWDDDCGFEADEELQVMDMLAGRDVQKKPFVGEGGAE